MSKAIFLDRDGVINRVILRDRRPFSPRNMDEFEILEGVSEAVALFQKVGLVVVVITIKQLIATTITILIVLVAVVV